MRPLLALVVPLGLLCFLSGCGSVPSTPNARQTFKTASDHDSSAAAYVIDPPDEIQIKSPNIKELDGQKQKVRSDGKISVNLVGEVKVSGMTPAQVKEMLSERAAKFYTSPDIQIEIVPDSKFYMVFGAGAAAGGQKAYTGNDSVIKALAQSGMTVDAWPEKVSLVRPSRGGREPAVVIVDFLHMADTGDFVQNYALEPGDMLYLPEGPLKVMNRDASKIFGPLTSGGTVIAAH